MYRCSEAPYYEPQNPSKFREGALIHIEVPKGDSLIEAAVRSHINDNPNMRGI